MLEKKFFPLRISINDKQGDCATELIHQFVSEARQKYDLQVIALPNNGPAIETHHAEAIIAVPFPDKERVRIDFNIFASNTEEKYDDALRFRFHMENACEG